MYIAPNIQLPTTTAAPAPATNPYTADWAKGFISKGYSAPTDINWDAYLAGNSDAKTHWNSKDPGVQALKDAGYTEDQYAAAHYVNDGAKRDLTNYNTYTIADNKAKEEAAAAAAAKAAQDKKIQDRRNSVDGAKGSALTSANDILSGYGLDPKKYGTQLGSYLDSISSSLYDSDSDPYAAFDANKATSSIITNETNAQRKALNSQFNKQFGPNYGDNLISDNLLDPIIGSILDEQQKGAADYLDRGKARGIFDDTGYSKGLSEIAKDRSIGMSSLTGLAGGVLDKYQAQANAIRDKAAGAMSGWSLGSSIDFSPYLKQGKSIAENATKFGEGDLRGALGGQNFFDLGELLQTSGQAQGATGAKDNTILAAIADRKKRDSASRGLGTQGSF